MRLYLCSGQFSIEVPDVHLSQGFIPTVGNCQAFDAENSEESLIEPASWFKVLVLDSVSIDCAKRAVSWCTINEINIESEEAIQTTQDESLGVQFRPKRKSMQRRVSESMYIGGECYGYHSDLDEVFDETVQILQLYTKTQLSSTDFHKKVIRLLHLYVLPAIHFTADDVGKVSDGLRLQQLAVTNIDEKLLAKNAQEQRIIQSLKRQRDKFIEELISHQMPCYPVAFLRALTSDVEQDVKNEWFKIDGLQNDVERAKKAAGSIAPIGVSLAALRDVRNAAVKDYEKLLTARELLKEIIDPPEVKSSPKRSLRHTKSRETFPLCDVYQGMKKELSNHYFETECLTRQKVMILSVREALAATIKELQRGEDSFGVDTDRTGLQKATDVLQLIVPLSWQTLTEQVTSILTASGNSVQEMHAKMCSYVRGKCKEALQEKNLLDDVVSASTSSPDSVSEEGSEGSVKSESIYRHNQRTSQMSTAASESSSKSCPVLGNNVPRDRRSKFYCSIASTLDLLDEGQASDLISVDALDFSNTKLTFEEERERQRRSNCLPRIFSSYSMENGTFPQLLEDGSYPRGDDQGLPDGMQESCPRLLQVEIPSSSMDDIVVVYDAEKDYGRMHIDQVTKQIKQHFSEIVPEIQKALSLEEPSYFRKIWLCYESHFYEAVTEDLMLLYDMQYKNTVASINKAFSDFTLNDLALADSPVLYMVNGIYEDRNSTSSSRMSQPKSNCSSLTPISENDDPLNHSDEGKKEGVGGRLLRYLSESASRKSQKRTSGEDLAFRTISVHHPVSVTLIYDRRTWPLKPVQDDFINSVDSADEALDIDAKCSDDLEKNGSTDSKIDCCCKKELQFRKKYRTRFEAAIESIEGLISEVCPLQKLQHLTKCLRELSCMSSELRVCSTLDVPGTDYLLDMVLLLICNVKPGIPGKLYSQIMMLTDILPPFFEAGPFNFALVQFYVAMQFIQSRLVVLRNRIAAEDESAA